MGMIYHKKRMWKKLSEKEGSEPKNQNMDYWETEREKEETNYNELMNYTNKLQRTDELYKNRHQ